MENKLRERLAIMTSTDQPYLAQSSFREIFQQNKKFCKQLIYIIQKLCAFGTDKIIKNKSLIQMFLMSIKTMLDATQYLKNGHKLPFIMYLQKFLQKKLKIKADSNSVVVYKKLQAFEKQNFYQDINFKSISNRQQNYLKSQQINQDIIDITNGDLKIHNNQCVGCSQVFIKNFEIVNYNPAFSVLVGLNEKQSDEINLEKYLCGVCNLGGGVIVIGAERRGKSIFATGINFKSAQYVDQKQKQLYKNSTFLKPDFHFNVQRVLVQTNFVQKDGIEEEQYRYCFRISIFPRSPTKKYYIEIFNKGYHNIYESYSLDENIKPYKILAQATENNAISFYTQAFEWYQKKKGMQNTYGKNPNCHRNIQCYKHCQQHSKLFTQKNLNSKQKCEIEGEKVKDEEYIHNDQPKFKYANTSLLAVGSKKKDRYVKDLNILMKNRKMLYELQKPFENSFKDGSRSIWMLSHHDKHDTIKSCIKDSDNTGSITMIPVYKTLQIDRTRLSYENQNQIITKFKQRYLNEDIKVDELEPEEENGLIKHPVLMSFSCYTHAIYCYMIFESMQMRPYFVKENTTYKKKPKTKSG